MMGWITSIINHHRLPITQVYHKVRYCHGYFELQQGAGNYDSHYEYDNNVNDRGNIHMNMPS